MNGSKPVCEAASGLEALECRLLLAAAEASAYAQYMLELVNAARADPAAYAAGLSISLNEGLPAGTISPAAKQPLTFNAYLLDAARTHSQWMLDTDTFSHTGQGGSSPDDRMATAGYDFTAPWGWGENIAWSGITPPSLPDMHVTTRQIVEDLFVDEGIAGRGHRLNLMDDDFREAGFGVLAGAFTGYNAVIATQDFAYDASGPFLTGVAYDDRLAFRDEFYTPGEGLGGITVIALRDGGGTYTTTTAPAGGYTLEVPAGTYTVRFEGGALDKAYQYTGVVVAGLNVKVDMPLADPPTMPNLTAPGAAGGTFYVEPGAQVDYTVTVRNTGTAGCAGDFTVSIYMADHAGVTAADPLADTYVVHGLAAGAQNVQVRSFAAPGVEGTSYFAVVVDQADAVPESNEADNWGAEQTLVVGFPNFTAALGAISLPDVFVPGDKATVSVTVTNAGTVPGGGTFDVAVYASADLLGPGAGDVLLATATARNVTIQPGAAKTFRLTVNITDALPAGTWHLLGVADDGGAVAESDETDNTAADATARELVWQFGTFGDRRNVKLAVHDAAGVLTTFQLSGGGWGEVGGGGDFESVDLHDTGAKSNARIAPAAGARTSIGALAADGHINGVLAARVDLRGEVDIAGTAGRITLGNAAGGQAIRIHTNAGLPLPPRAALTLTLEDVRDLAVSTEEVPIKSLTALNWGGAAGPGNTIAAPSIGKLNVKGQKAGLLPGDFAAVLDLPGAVGSARIAGDLTGQWDILSAGSVRVGGDMSAATLALAQAPDAKLWALGKLDVKGWIDDSRILAGGNVKSVSAGGVRGSDIFAAVAGSPPAHALGDPTTDFAGEATIAAVTIKGTVADDDGYSTLDVMLAAAAMGKVGLRNAPPADASPQEWGLAAHSLAAFQYADAAVRYSWEPGGLDAAPTAPGGDFRAVLA